MRDSDERTAIDGTVSYAGPTGMDGDPYHVAEVVTTETTIDWRMLAETLREDADVLEKAHAMVADDEWSIEKATKYIAAETNHGSYTVKIDEE